MSATGLELVSHGPEETQRIGRLLGNEARPGDIFLLVGPLGAGKTCLTQGIAWGLGVQEYARSPTFVLITRYQGRLTMHHVDLFRIEDPLEAQDLGLEEYLSGEGICVVEWADRAAQLFPSESLWIEMKYGVSELERIIRFHTNGIRHLAHLEPLRSLPGSQKCC